jgi:type I restriction enzyme S subunit
LFYTDDENGIEKYRLKHNDVLFNRTNSPELVGKTAIYKSETPAIFAGYLIRIHRRVDLLDADYLNYFLNSDMALDYGKTVTISSVNQANINGSKLKTYPIPVPQLSEQRAIVQKLDEIAAESKRLIAIYERKLAALKALRKSLLHRAFTGQL